MEIKHTIEILTKDIQDIEKLVRNLNNYETPPQIEIDLALSRLRNVYDLLSIIARDIKSDTRAGDASASAQHASSGETATTTQHSPGQEQAPMKEQSPDRQPSGNQAPASAQEQPPASPEKVKGTESGSGTNQKKKETARKTSILAEKFASDKSINERSAPGSGHDLSSKLTGEPIDSIKRNIGINDRFLIIRELMDGNNEAFNDLVQQIDTQQNFDAAYSIIQSAFPDLMEHEGVNILIRLSRRRYLSR
jgi:hypothetical protein